MEEPQLPPRMFAAGEEPLGERVNSFHKIKKTELLIDALEPDELEFLRNLTFGKVIAIDENSQFSGAFGQHLIFRLLKVNKKMSLREYAIVTGLNCGKLPEPIKKKRNPLKEKVYWNELFGSLKFCTVDTVIDMLKKKLGSFHTLATSLISKDEIALAQSSVAIRGYVDAIQLVLLAAIPQLKEEITHTEAVFIVDSESEGETRDEKTPSEDENVATNDKPPHATKYCLILGHSKNADSECQVPVRSILDDPYEEWSAGLDFLWVDETEDVLVDNMVCLICEGFFFLEGNVQRWFDRKRSCMNESREETQGKRSEKNNKDPVVEVTDGEVSSDSQAHILIARLVSSQLGDKFRYTPTDFHDELRSLEKRIDQALDLNIERLVASANHLQQVAHLQSTVVRCVQDIETKIGQAIADQVKIMQTADIETKIGQAIADQVKIMQTAVIKGVIEAIANNSSSRPVLEDYHVPEKSSDSLPSTSPVNTRGRACPLHPTPSEVADSRIEEVLVDLNTPQKCIDPANTDAAQPNLGDQAEDVEGNHVSDPVSLQVLNIPLLHLPPPPTPLILFHYQCRRIGDGRGNPFTASHSLFFSLTYIAELLRLSTYYQMHIPCYLLEMPSFSLGLSQEDAPVVTETVNPINYVLPSNEPVEEARRSKRPRITPAVLQDYKCNLKVPAGVTMIPDLEQCFKLMEEAVKKEAGIVLLNRYSVTASDICDIASRTTILPTGVRNNSLRFFGWALVSMELT
ncbi:hypothetical protein Bca52824_035557 [Brassica carinata]|uniref:DUF1985 domain-containing protein n=1 Tax=Brassica carinata TaxID=52824 RepID=A0A8X7V0P4_BRACI|nr:hypothetical protein Bca52824_035557 [Brassica carinata]